MGHRLRSLAAVLCLASAPLLICACDKGGGGGQASSGGTGTATTSTTGKKLTIGVSIPAADHGWTAGVGWWAKKAMAMYPDVNWVYKTADGPTKQNADIDDMITQNVDGLVILATESAPLTDVADKAHAAGVYIVNVDRGFTKPGIADVFIEGDNKAFGRKSAQFITDKLGGKGTVAILSGIPCTVDTDRVNAAMDVFKAHPDIKVIGPQPAFWSREKGLAAMQAILAQNPHIDAVWAQDDDTLLGAQQAITEAHRDKEMWIFGGAGMKDVVKMVMDNNPSVPADITYPPSMVAAAIQMAVSNLRDGKSKDLGQFMPKHMVLDVDLVTPENAKNYYFPDSVY